ncbi:MAG: hypothetical protein IPP32_01575 [Bacteroidetes bacterium]|nr:hypothetical protein [Bacteroidota bacterium]
MKLFTTLLAISFLVFSRCGAQDLVLMHKGDSLNCKITSVDEQFIHATLTQGNEDKKILLSHTLVKYFEYNYYLKPPAERNVTKKEDIRDDYVVNRNKQKYKKKRIAISGGWSYLTAKPGPDIPADFSQYYQELRSGYNIAVDAQYFFGKYVGVGVDYVMFKTKNSYSPVYIIDTITKRQKAGELSDDITVQYFGPSFFTRLPSASGMVTFYPYVSIGYIAYRDKGMAVYPVKITANTVGRKTGIILEYLIEDMF